MAMGAAVTEPLTDPLVPPDVDLRDFGFMPLDVLRLRDSDLAALATGDEFKAAVLLWCVAWHQVPAASLPNDDRLLARYSGAGPAWKRVRAEALRGFVACSDGRLYHATIAEKALEAWAAKASQRARTKAATEAREAKRRAQQAERDESRNVPRDEQRDVERNVVQGTGTGTGTGKEEKENPPASRVPPTASPRASRKCPPGFELTADLRAWAASEHPGVSVDRETASFLDHTFATARTDWPGTWRNWIRKAAGMNGIRNGAPPRQTATERRISTIEALTGRSSSHERPADERSDVVEVEARLVP